MVTEEDELLVSEYIDKVCSTQPRPVLQNVSLNLYRAARQKQGRPLSYLASKTVLDAAKKGSYIFITTGAGDPTTTPKGETDGPIGAAGLARAVAMLGAVPVIISEQIYLDPIVAPCQAAGLKFDDKSGELQAVAKVFPFGKTEGEAAAKELFKDYRPTLVVSTERLGPNSKGVNHNMKGEDWSPYQARMENLLLSAKDQGIMTLGVGDGGNELGCGLILEEAKKSSRYGAKCQCPCGAGVACAIPSDVLMIGASSNWGCFGIEAGLAALTNRPELLHSPKMDWEMLTACIGAGGHDGSAAKPVMFVDGSPEEVHQTALQFLGHVVNGYVTSPHIKL